jgi:hypothetical protein
MRLKIFVPVVLLAVTFGASAQQSGTSAVPSPVWNDNSLIDPAPENCTTYNVSSPKPGKQEDL